MSREAELIAQTPTPQTRAGMAEELQTMGLRAGDLVMVHTSQSRLGWICGGEQAVISALQDVLGPDGTLAMPGFSSQLSDPADWSSPPVPKDWVQQVRDNMPVFDLDKTPTRGMGRVAELFRKWPETRRSSHVVDSILANGRLASEIIADHPFSGSFGPQSPIGKMNAMGAKVLLLGADYMSCSCFHLAESDLPGIAPMHESHPIERVQGVTRWHSVLQPQMFEGHFGEIGVVLDAQPDVVTQGFSGAARLFSMDTAVATARAWLLENIPGARG